MKKYTEAFFLKTTASGPVMNWIPIAQWWSGFYRVLSFKAELRRKAYFGLHIYAAQKNVAQEQSRLWVKLVSG